MIEQMFLDKRSKGNLLNNQPFYQPVRVGGGLKAPWNGLAAGAWTKDNQQTPYGIEPVVTVIPTREPPYLDSANGNIGGIGEQSVRLDSRSRYRFTLWVWVDNPYTTDVNKIFFGTSTGNRVQNSRNGEVNNNPYFMSPSSGALPQKEWLLFVGYLNPKGTQKTISECVIYRANGQLLTGANFGEEFTFANDGYQDITHRSFSYYGNKKHIYARFFHPRIDEMDGNQPTIQDILIRKWR